MITRGSEYKDTFNFKSSDGQPVLIGNRKFEIIMYRNEFVRRYDENNGLDYGVDNIILTIPASETSKFRFSKILYTVNEIFEDGVSQIYSGGIDVT